MKQWISQRMFLLYSSVFTLYILNLFLEIETINYVVGLLAIPALTFAFLFATRLFKVLGGLFLVLGFVMYGSSGLPYTQLPLFLTSNMNLLAFLSVLPWINSAARVGRYDERIKQLMKGDATHLGELYPRSMVTSGILMTFLNLSAVNLSQNILIGTLKNFKKKIRDQFIARSTIRAYALTMIWSPMEIMVGITVDATGISYLVYLPWLLLISAVVLIIDILFQRRHFKSIPYRPADSAMKKLSQKKIYIQVLKLFTALGLFLTIVILTSHWFNLDFILAVTLVIIPFSFLWSLVMKRVSEFVNLGYYAWKEQTNHMQNFVVLFISLSLFSNSLNETPILSLIQQPFMTYQASPLIILGLILMTYISLGMLGVHPIATIGVLLEVLKPLFEIFNPLGIGIMLIIGALATASSGTYGVVVTMTSLNTQQNPYRITVTNLSFTFMFGIIGMAVAYMLL